MGSANMGLEKPEMTQNELIEFIRKMYTFPDMAPMATIGDENVDLCLSLN